MNIEDIVKREIMTIEEAVELAEARRLDFLTDSVKSLAVYHNDMRYFYVLDRTSEQKYFYRKVLELKTGY